MLMYGQGVYQIDETLEAKGGALLGREPAPIELSITLYQNLGRSRRSACTLPR